jgi:hypothetical protein
MLRRKLRQAFEQMRVYSSRFLLHISYLSSLGRVVSSMRLKCIVATFDKKRRPREGIMLEARRVFKLLCERVSAEVESMIYEKHAYLH